MTCQFVLGRIRFGFSKREEIVAVDGIATELLDGEIAEKDSGQAFER
jgi:hypothetical protein